MYSKTAPTVQPPPLAPRFEHSPSTSLANGFQLRPKGFIAPNIRRLHFLKKYQQIIWDKLRQIWMVFKGSCEHCVDVMRMGNFSQRHRITRGQIFLKPWVAFTANRQGQKTGNSPMRR
jgi:hypothetical protein